MALRSSSHRPTEPNPGYAAVAVYLAGKDHPTLLNVDGRVVIFDTPEMARWAMPQLGGGRPASWSDDREWIYFNPISTVGVNRACVVTDYDVYNLPPNHPVLSEARGRDWKRHID